MLPAPPELVWERQASAFIDALIERDIYYLDCQVAIEKLIHAGLHDEITQTFELDEHTIHWHLMPPLFPGAKALDIFTTVEQNGAIRVLHIRIAHGR